MVKRCQNTALCNKGSLEATKKPNQTWSPTLWVVSLKSAPPDIIPEGTVKKRRVAPSVVVIDVV